MIEIINAGKLIINTAGLITPLPLFIFEFTMIKKNRLITRNPIPPTQLFCQAKNMIIPTANTGRLCIINPIRISINETFPSNTSNENIIINKQNRIDYILGAQCRKGFIERSPS